jgi:hypothetical protein
MRGDGEDNGPKIPIPGSAGALVYVALKSMAMHAGECSLTIEKVRVAGGGYVYRLTRDGHPTAGPIR